jgi:hypothetical protein
MDRATNSTAPADRLFCAIELSKKSWLLGIQFPDRQKASVYPIKGGDSEDLIANTRPDHRCNRAERQKRRRRDGGLPRSVPSRPNKASRGRQLPHA